MIGASFQWGPIMKTNSLASGWRSGACAVIAAIALSALGSAPANAGVGASTVPNLPTPVNVGDVFSASLTITNASDGSAGDSFITALGLFITPSCAAGTGTCSDNDPGVFAISNPTAGAGTGCSSTTFTLG